MAEKYDQLLIYLKKFGRIAVAFSGGVDSALLLKASVDALGPENVLAVTADSEAFPQRELNEGSAFCRTLGVRQEIFAFDQLGIPGFCDNPPNRCYLCKKALFEGMLNIASGRGFDVLAEGTNTDDEKDYRPGLRALAELGIESPLRACGLSKSEIREISRYLGLESGSKPSLACLATRIPYGERITAKKLMMADEAEGILFGMGFNQARVRIHGEDALTARIEVPEDELNHVLTKTVRPGITEAFKRIGFSYTALDLEGYRTGSMNEVL